MHVLGDVDQLRKIRKSAHHLERLPDRQHVEQRLELALDGGRIGGASAPEANGSLPNRLDAPVSRFAGLREQHVAEQTTEQARVLLERQILVGHCIHGDLSTIVASLQAAPNALCSPAPSWCLQHHSDTIRPAAMNRETTMPHAWQALSDHRRALGGRTIASLFADDAQRFAQLSLTWDYWLADFSKQRVTPETIALLIAHAREGNLGDWIDALFAGEKVNLSEGRPALHTALRQQNETPLTVAGTDVIPAIRAVQTRMRELTGQLRGGTRVGATGRPLRNVVNIGIGGSDLGPRLVCDALG